VPLLKDAARATRAARLIEVLAHPTRVRLVAALCAEEAASVGDLAARLQLAPASVEQHLEALEREGLIERSSGPEPGAYRIAEPALHGLVACMEECSR
jgi:DNA-binding transcriptional ArsR family regulator